METREKASSVIKGKVKYGVEEIGKDLVSLISLLDFKPQKFIPFGTSLGATAILDSCRFLERDPFVSCLSVPTQYFESPNGLTHYLVLSAKALPYIKPVIRGIPERLRWILKVIMPSMRNIAVS